MMSNKTVYKLEDTKIGNDIEFFLVNPSKNNELVPSFGLLQGTKDSPRKVVGGYISEDNISAEVSTDPATTEDEFVDNLTTIMGSLREVVGLYDLDLLITPSIELPSNILMMGEAHEVGCSPDFDPWGRRIKRNKRPSFEGVTRRFNGGHVHISNPIFENNICRKFAAMAFDKYLGVPALLLDNDIYRKELYGSPGAHRPTEYPNGDVGIEYRVLSNFWSKSEALQRWVYQQSLLVIQSTIDAYNSNKYKLDQGDTIKAAILNNNRDYARDVVDYFDLTVPVV